MPAYKEFANLTESEQISWWQSTKVYHQYDFVLACPMSLNTSGYVSESLARPVQIERFADSYFTSTSSYNKLMLSLDFFQRFAAYEFMLVCQLDVFVFYNALPEWCAKNYSYVGPPWFKGFIPEPDQAELWRVGNGGFSLRKVADSLRVLHSFRFVFDWTTLVRECFSKGFVAGLVQLPTYAKRMLLGNNTHHRLNDYPSQEDVFWSIICQDRFGWYTVPSATEALMFGFDHHPSIMLKLNEGRLPMGFHAWDRHRNDFWAQEFAKFGYSPADIMINQG
ncbi:DUF5672 family protein [Hymenobacter terrenus]|uniref:DUF5672 family protein n=1 Tax=Hymenobacter terrenus TaxID=1629124 RepID=UPI001E64A0F4|nr:DUF5672 family protein [Hymenobacter terrenus]